MQYLYCEIFKLLKIYESKWLSSWIEWLNIIKMAVLPKLVYRLNIVFIRIQALFLSEIDADIQADTNTQIEM